MAGIEKIVNGDITLFTVSGTVPIDEYQACIHDFYTVGPVTLNSLWDLSLADGDHFTSEEIGNMATAVAGVVGKRPGGKTAIVASEDLMFGLARMYEFTANLEEAGIMLRVFRTRAEAMQWLESKE